MKSPSLFRAYLPEANTYHSEISKWSVGMHIDHCALAMTRVCKTLLASSPPPPKDSFSLLRTVVFFTKRIPRGRGKAPDAALPRENISTEQLSTLLDEVEDLLAQAKQLPPQHWLKHHVFGILNRDQAFQFIDIHNQHHLRIIDDIISLRKKDA